MPTVKQTIDSALALLGLGGEGVTHSMNEYQDAIMALNMLMDSWSTLSTLPSVQAMLEVDYAPGVATYSFGPTGTWSIAAIPSTIIQVSDYDPITGEEDCVEPLTFEDYASIIDKGELMSEPLNYYLDANRPNANITLWPIPSQAGKLRIYYHSAQASITNINSNIYGPNGFQRALVYNLAVELAPQYGVTPNPIVLQTAVTALCQYRNTVVQPLTDLRTDARLFDHRNGRIR